MDDGSTDASWAKMVEMSKKIPHLRVIRFRRNFGQTAAMSAGFDHARGEVIVTLDADLQNDPADIPKLLDRADQGFDVVSGWRKDRKDPFLNRRLPSMIANALISKITGVDLHDYGCTLKAYHRDVIKNVRLYGEMHRFIPALASWVGGPLDEVVVSHHPRRFGTVQVRHLAHDPRDPRPVHRQIPPALQHGADPDVRKARRAVRHPRPAHACWSWRSATCRTSLFGTEFAADLVKRPFWIMTAFMLIFFGVQFVSMGLLAEMQIRTYHESQDKPIYVIKETVESQV